MLLSTRVFARTPVFVSLGHIHLRGNLRIHKVITGETAGLFSTVATACRGPAGQRVRVLVSPRPRRRSLSPLRLTSAPLVGSKCRLPAVLARVSLTITNLEHLFMWPVAIPMPSLSNV